MRILFINPWLKTLFGDERARPGHPHLGLSYLISTLKENGIGDIEVFDQGLENDDSLLFRKIDEFRPELIGLTTFSYCRDYATDLVKLIKERTSAPLIAGGPHVSAMGEKIFKDMPVDFAMQGESEASFIRFLNEFSGMKKYSSVPNLIWRDKQGGVKVNPQGPLITEVDKIPFPSYEEFGFERYNYYESRSMPIITSRGCPYNCNYCSVMLSMGKKFRARSPESVISEMKHWIARYGIRGFEINDDCFSLDLKRAERICDLIIREGLNIKYELYNGIRPDRVTKRLFTKMKNSGCVFLSFGCESGDQEVVDRMGKNLRIESVSEAVKLANSAGIRNSVNFIIGHSGETYEKTLKSIKLAEELPTNFVNFYNVIPYPGTELYDWAVKNAEGMMPLEQYLGKVGSRDLTPVFWTKDFTREERIEALKKGYDLYQKTILKFRFGKRAGALAYLLSKNNFLFTLGRKFALDSRVGFKMYSLLTRNSRKV